MGGMYLWPILFALSPMTAGGKKTPGHKQHMNYARLRAIETRTWVARSANTGISCFIDPNGQVYNPQPYDTSSDKTSGIFYEQTDFFFVRNGDILSKIMIVLAGVFLMWVIYLSKVMKRFFKSKFPALQE